MRYRGKKYTGEGVSIAIIDSGINPDDPRLAGVDVTGWSIQLSATGHALLGADFHDENGHGTEVAVAISKMAPGAQLLGVKIMGARLKTSADLMAAGIETASRNGCRVINMSLGTPNMGKALLLRDCAALAVETGSIVLAAAHPMGERAYPADLPETVGVASHKDCPLDKYYYFAPHRFPRKEWGNLTGKFLAHGFATANESGRRPYRSSSMATAYLTGRIACLAEALPNETPMGVVEVLKQLALTPVPEIGYG
jgi:subtilisin family serine protease